jgi:hypothetical protein
MRLANAFCRFAELAARPSPPPDLGADGGRFELLTLGLETPT